MNEIIIMIVEQILQNYSRRILPCQRYLKADQQFYHQMDYQILVLLSFQFTEVSKPSSHFSKLVSNCRNFSFGLT